MRDEITQRVTGFIGFGGAGVVAGLSVTEIELWVRIGVGVLSIISIAVHTYIAISKHRDKDK